MRPLNVVQTCNLIIVLQFMCTRKQKWGCRQNLNFFGLWFFYDFISQPWDYCVTFFPVFLLFRLGNAVVTYFASGFLCSLGWIYFNTETLTQRNKDFCLGMSVVWNDRHAGWHVFKNTVKKVLISYVCYYYLVLNFVLILAISCWKC